jgi:hypothetical protein
LWGHVDLGCGQRRANGYGHGEDGTEVANPPTVCATDCQAQNKVNGRLANLGLPLPVPVSSQLTPRTSDDGLAAPLTP